jgi:serine/threonine protein kinase
VIEKHEKSLLSKINKRKQKGKHFDEPQVWHFLFNSLSLLTYLQQENFELGNISLKTIVKTSKKIMKFMDSSLTGSTNKIDAQANRESPMLAPEIFSKLKEHGAKIDYDFSKSDVFSLGLVILMMCNLENEARDIHNYSARVVSQHAIDDRIQRVGDRYSELLTCVVSDMLRINEEERPDATALAEFLSEYEGDCKAGRIRKNHVKPIKRNSIERFGDLFGE